MFYAKMHKNMINSTVNTNPEVATPTVE